MAQSSNRMTAAELTAVAEQQWQSQGGFSDSCRTLDFACGMQADGLNAPSLDKWTVTYGVPDTDIDLVSLPHETGVNVSGANASILIRNMDSSTRVFFSVEEPPVWVEVQELTAAAGLADGVEQYNTGDAPVFGGNRLRIRVLGDHSRGDGDSRLERKLGNMTLLVEAASSRLIFRGIAIKSAVRLVEAASSRLIFFLSKIRPLADAYNGIWKQSIGRLLVGREHQHAKEFHTVSFRRPKCEFISHVERGRGAHQAS